MGSAGWRGARRQDTRQCLHRAGQRDELRAHATACVRRQVERLGAKQTNFAVEADEIDRTAGFRQSADDTDRVRQCCGQRTHFGEWIVCCGIGHLRRLKRSAITEPFTAAPSLINRAFNRAEQTVAHGPEAHRPVRSGRAAAGLGRSAPDSVGAEHRQREHAGIQAARYQVFAATLGDTGISPARTQPNHLAGTVGTTAANEVVDRTHMQSPDGNAVALDEQIVKVADTETTHALVTAIYRKYLGMFATALGRTSSG
jgi:flagellar basal-body rod protein FlgB